MVSLNHFNESRNGRHYDEAQEVRTFLVRLEDGQRLAHTAKFAYQLTMASLQIGDIKAPKCYCSTIDKGKKKANHEDKVFVIIENDLKEFLLCVLDNKNPQCKLDVRIQPGEQIALRSRGKFPVLLHGTSFPGNK